MLGLVSTPLNQFHDDKARKQQFGIAKRVEPLQRRGMLAQNIDHYIGVNEKHPSP